MRPSACPSIVCFISSHLTLCFFVYKCLMLPSSLPTFKSRALNNSCAILLRNISRAPNGLLLIQGNNDFLVKLPHITVPWRQSTVPLPSNPLNRSSPIYPPHHRAGSDSSQSGREAREARDAGAGELLCSHGWWCGDPGWWHRHRQHDWQHRELPVAAWARV